jgi:hypothetical protein
MCKGENEKHLCDFGRNVNAKLEGHGEAKVIANSKNEYFIFT